jgi:hypothetical protein
MNNSEQIMATHRTSAQWQQLLQLRDTFNGTNIEFV